MKKRRDAKLNSFERNYIQSNKDHIIHLEEW